MKQRKTIFLVTLVGAIVLAVGIWQFFVPNRVVLNAWLGDRQSMFEAGIYYSFPTGDPEGYISHKATYNPHWARYWFFRAAENGHPDAMYRISEEYGYPIVSYYGDRPRWLPFDTEKQSYWLNKAAESGSHGAIGNLVRKYEIHPFQPDLFIHWAEKGANQDDRYCLIELSKAYQYGSWGVPADPIKARYWEDKLNKLARQHPYGW